MLRYLLSSSDDDVIVLRVNPTGARVLTLCDFTLPLAALVDWGDGAFSPLTANTPLSHTYADTTTRQVRISGTLGGFWHNSFATGKDMVVAVESMKSRSLTSLAQSFQGCSKLASLPGASGFDTPNVTNFSGTFKDIRSVRTELPALWAGNPGASHANCFTNCFHSCWGEYNRACPKRQYMNAVAQQTYYKRYGRENCPSATYVPAEAGVTLAEVRAACSDRSSYVVTFSSEACARTYTMDGVSCTVYMGRACSPRVNTIYSNNGSLVQYSKSTDASVDKALRWCLCKPENCFSYYIKPVYEHYSCSYFNQYCQLYGCTRIYQYGYSAYYRCTASGSDCATSGCLQPLNNATSYLAAQKSGWA